MPEINGKPAAKITMGLHEKIGLPDFSNVDIGPISIERYVEDTQEARVAGLREITAECEELLAEERKKVLDFLRAEGVIS